MSGVSPGTGGTAAVHTHRVRNSLLVGGSAIITVVAVVAATLWLSLSSAVAAVTRVPSADIFPDEAVRPVAAPVDEDNASPINILVLGTDSRSGAGDADDLQSGDQTGQRSDTMMLVHISADRRSIATISIMRDSWVDIPGYGENKINAAMSYGGTPLAVQTVEDLLGVRIDHVAVVDFAAFEAVTDTLGGIDVESDVAFDSQNVKGFSFTQGTNHLNGEAALAFVRERYAFADGDYQRVRNQRAVVKGIADSLFKAAGSFDVGKFTDAVKAASDHIIVDEGLDLPTLISLGSSLANISREDVVGFTLPSTGTGTSADGQSIVNLDQDAVDQVRDALADDTIVHTARDLGLTD